MENLTKQQIVLVTLLVSFVTSIATGIVTVSLVDQAPAGVTQTINRVVEKTIERVVQAPAQATVVMKEKIIKADDLVVAAIEMNKDSMVRVFREGITDDNPEPHQIFETVGFVVSKDGLIISDKVITLFEAKRFIRFADGKLLPLELVSSPEKSQVALVRALLEKGKTHEVGFVTLGDSNGVKLGATIVAIGGKDKDFVSPGVVTSLETRELKLSGGGQSTTTPPVMVISLIEVSSEPRQALGGPLINLSGEVIGIKTSDDASREGAYTPVSAIKEIMLAEAAASAETKKTE